jgi:hypothetical protein
MVGDLVRRCSRKSMFNTHYCIDEVLLLNLRADVTWRYIRCYHKRIRRNWYADWEPATYLTPSSTTHLLNVTGTRHATVQIPLSLWKPKLRYLIQKPPPTVLIPIQATPDHSWPRSPTNVPKNHFNIMVPNTSIVWMVILPFTFLVHNRDSADGIVSKLSI